MIRYLKAFIGWTGEGALAHEVCKNSLAAKSSAYLHIHPLQDWALRGQGYYARPYYVQPDGQRIDGVDKRPFSTDFSFTRFLVPALSAYADEWVLYCDSDMLWLDDVAKLLDHIQDSPCAVHVVQHPPYQASTTSKMNGQVQTQYKRKNWSSLVLFHARRCMQYLPHTKANQLTGTELHGFSWLPDEMIGNLPARWNWLLGEQPVIPDPAVVHFTLGTPDMRDAFHDNCFSPLWERCAAALHDGRDPERIRLVLENEYAAHK